MYVPVCIKYLIAVFNPNALALTGIRFCCTPLEGAWVPPVVHEPYFENKHNRKPPCLCAV